MLNYNPSSAQNEFIPSKLSFYREIAASLYESSKLLAEDKGIKKEYQDFYTFIDKNRSKSIKNNIKLHNNESV